MIQAIIAILIAGSSWIFLPSQVEAVGSEFAAAYRLFLGGLALLVFNLFKKKELPPLSGVFFARVFFFALFMYSVNYLLCYESARYIPSGYIALIISAMIIPNIIYGRLFLKKEITMQALLGALTSIIGLTIIFLPETTFSGETSNMTVGLGLAFTSIFFSGLGTVIGVRLSQSHNYSMNYLGAFGLLIGGATTFVYAMIHHQGIRFSTDFTFLRDLVYLSVFTLPFVFVVYGKIALNYGADKAAYIWVMAPIVSLTLSTFFESVMWNYMKFAGVAITILGGAVALTNRGQLRRFARILSVSIGQVRAMYKP